MEGHSHQRPEIEEPLGIADEPASNIEEILEAHLSPLHGDSALEEERMRAWSHRPHRTESILSDIPRNEHPPAGASDDFAVAVPRVGEVKRGKVQRERFCVFDRFQYSAEESAAQSSPEFPALVIRRQSSSWGIFEADKLNAEPVGLLESNFLGTKYRIKHRSEARYVEVCYIEYKNNMYSTRGPRSFKLFMNSPGHKLDALPLSERVRLGKTDSYIALTNKRPIYNMDTSSYVLNFNGRVTLPSVKNFQVIHPNDSSYITLMFGKIGDNDFVLDFTYPWNALEAFGVAVSSLVFKLGCE